MDISTITAVRAYCAYLLGGTLRRIGCKIRPYEVEAGATDSAIRAAQLELVSAFSGEVPLLDAVPAAFNRFEHIEVSGGDKPKVAIFGDFYSRDNTVLNQDLIHSIEAAGGEVVTTPYNEYLKIVSDAYYRRWWKNGEIRRFVTYRTLHGVINIIEKLITRYFPTGLQSPFRVLRSNAEDDLERFQMSLFNEGESYDNILKILGILREHPDLALFVQASPAFCCPSLVTEAMKTEIEAATGVPVLSITYDGTGTPKNDIIVPYVNARR